jgi:hypothetical protein
MEQLDSQLIHDTKQFKSVLNMNYIPIPSALLKNILMQVDVTTHVLLILFIFYNIYGIIFHNIKKIILCNSLL